MRVIGSVFCVNIASSGVLAVTGGEDDKAFVWQLDSGKVVLECTGQFFQLLIAVIVMYDQLFVVLSPGVVARIRISHEEARGLLSERLTKNYAQCKNLTSLTDV